MQKFAVINASRMAALAATGKVVSFFLKPGFSPHVTSLIDLPLDFRTLPAWHRPLRAHMLLRNLVRRSVLLHIRLVDSLPLSFAVTRHCSCIGGVLHPGVSDSWFFRRQQCRRNWPRSQYVLTVIRSLDTLILMFAT